MKKKISSNRLCSRAGGYSTHWLCIRKAGDYGSRYGDDRSGGHGEGGRRGE
ncbi:MAG: hypothetical protein ACLTQG_01370 [Hungatella sp.]|uniref:hypothetical protein n=1 Tax=Hungatella sp. TaxID=2613924 RepID=UPI003995F9AB